MFVVFVLVSLVGGLLCWWLVGCSSSVIDNFNVCIKVWWWMIGVLVIVFWIGKIGVVVLFVFILL